MQLKTSMRVISKCRMAIMPILAADALLRESKNPVKNVTPSGDRTHNL